MIIIEENESDGSGMGMEDMSETTSNNMTFTLPKKINEFKAHSNSRLMKKSSLPASIKSRSGF